MSTTSGASCGRASTASAPSPASPTTSMSGSAPSIMPEADAHQRLVVDEQDTDHDCDERSGRRARRAKPPPGLGPAVAARRRPRPARAFRRARARLRRNPARPRRRRRPRSRARRPPRRGGCARRARAGPACLSVFVRPSWTMRYAEKSRPGGSVVDLALDRQIDRKPRCAHAGRRDPRGRRRPGCGASEAPSSSRRSDAEHPSHLGQRLPGRSARSCRAPRARRPIAVAQHAPRRARLQQHDADRVRDDVVQLVRDPRPLLGHRCMGSLVGLALDLVRATLQRALAGTARHMTRPATNGPPRT